jgi:uracil-DNA glycosylase family 4
VVTLGAFASNLLLEGQERLSKIHGNFFPRSFSDNFHTQIVPLFHPNFLLINPSMKKSAWMDMQKIMDFVGKSLA